MANNRIYIRCKGCKGFMPFAKFYPSDYGCGWFSYTGSDEFNNFFERHGKCNKMDNYGDFWDILTEGDSRLKLIDFEKSIIILKKDKGE